MSLTAQAPQPTLAWQFQSSNVDSITGLAPNLSTTGTYAAPTGGTITTVPATGQRVHSFTSVGTTSITFLVPVTATVLVVAGGGGGGAISSTTFSPGGGGGAGEVYYSSSYSIPAGTYTVTVGDGGAGGPQGGSSQNGLASVFGSISAAGGGHGGDGSGALTGADGGSGGGSARQGGAGGLSVKTAGGQGNNGGASTGFSGAGGGGAGGVGVNQTDATTSSVGTAGGPGVSYSITGAPVTYGAGGKGGDRGGTATNGANGANNSGNGGGGASSATGATGGKGGSGRVVISYVSALYPAPTYVNGVYGQAISFNNTLSPAGSEPNCYAIYDISAFNISSNSATMALWVNSGLTYPITSGCNPYYVNFNGTTYYSLQTENNATYRSNISFHTGAVGGNFVSRAIQTGVWNHYCYVCSNVGASSSNTITYAYLNGTFIGSSNNYIQNFTEMRLACQNAQGNGALCSIDDIRIFNQPLTDTQVQAIYSSQGMPGQANLIKSPIQPGYVYEPYNNYTVVGNPDVKIINSSNPDPRIYVDPASPQYSQWTADANLLTEWNLMPFKYYILLSSVFISTATDGLSFPVYVPTTGTYDVQIFIYGAGGNTDSGFIGMDGEAGIQYGAAILGWRTGLSAKSLTAGNHTLELYMREQMGIGGIRIFPTGGVGATLTTFRQNMLGTPNFSQLSASAASSMTGAFSLRAVNGTSVKAVQVKRQSDNATLDFWADRLGNLLTAPVTGQALVDWLGGSTGNVVTWYDQSGKGNHVSQVTVANQPLVNLSNATISFNGSQWLSNATTTGMFIPLYQNAYSVVTKHRQWTVGAAWSTGNTASFVNFSFNGLRWATGNNYQNYRGGGFLSFGPQPGTYPVVATVVNDRTIDIGYINGVQSATQTGITPNVEPVYPQYIGFDANSGTNRLQGELHAVVFFSSAISAADRTIVESLI